MINKVMKLLIKYFLNGVLFLTPVMLTIVIISKILAAWDKTAGKIFAVEIPGLALIISIVVIIVVGYVASWWVLPFWFQRRVLRSLKVSRWKM